MTTLYRAADDDYIGCDCTAFAADRETAEVYLDNPGYGGSSLWTVTVDVEDSALLDLTDESDPVTLLCDEYGLSHPGAIGVDEWIPQSVAVTDALREAGIDWVLVPESYPADTVTWLWVGPSEREPELTEIGS